MNEEIKTKTRSIIRGNLVGVVATDSIDKILDNIVEDLERMHNNESIIEGLSKSLDIAQGEAGGMANC